MRASQPPDLCGPTCRYRALYQGSQESLDDLHAKHAASVSRYENLRSGVVSVMKRCHTREVRELEKKSGQRLAHVDDHSLLTYLEGFARQRPVPAGRGDLDGLRAALEAVGFDLGDDDSPEMWAQHILMQHRQAPAPPLGPVPEPGAAPPRIRVEGDIAELFATAATDPPGDTPDAAPTDTDGGGHTAPAQPADPSADVDVDLAELFDEDLDSEFDDLVDLDPVVDIDDLFADDEPADDLPPADIAPPNLPQGYVSSDEVTRGQMRPTISPQPSAGTRPKRRSPSRQPAAKASRPVFAADLVAGGLADETVRNWETHMRSQTKPQVRFVSSPKRSARLGLGSLILPVKPGDAPAEWRHSTWASYVEAYKGIVLYELGAAVRDLGDKIVSSQLTTELVTIRANLPQGLTGMVIAVSADVGAAMGEAVTKIGELTTERLSSVLVLVMRPDHEQRASERLEEALAGVDVTVPVAVATLHRYIEDPRASATLVRGIV